MKRSFAALLVVACSPATSAPDASAPDAGMNDASTGGDASAVDGSADAKQPGTPQPGDVVVDPSKTHQRMDGFGASDAWAGTTMTAAQADLFFDVQKGVGLSFLRVGISETAALMGGGELGNAKLAALRGARVWAAPWSPPASAKDNTNIDNGGHLLAASYDAWATSLAGFATMMQSNGVPLYGVSAQNEPDFVASYASCIFSAAQMVAFVKVLGPKLAALSPRPKLIAPEPDVWSHLWTNGDAYGNALLADTTAAGYVDVLATHDYAHQPIAPTSTTKPIWETEVSGISGTGNCNAVCYGPNATIDNGLLVGKWIYDAIVTGGASAWHYWWLFPAGADNEGLVLQDGTATKRLYVLGNFSKFVRPDWVRIDATNAPAGVSMVAFTDPVTNAVAIVAINSTASDVAASFFVGGSAWPGAVTPWVTSASDDLAGKASVPLAGARFSVTIPASSVVTYASN